MRLCTIVSGGKPVVGVKTADGARIVDLSKQMPRGPKSCAISRVSAASAAFDVA